MGSTPQSRLDLLESLVGIPGVTATPEEDNTARFIYDWLASLAWFREHPEDIVLIPTPLQGDKHPLHGIAALVRAASPTQRTIILTGHFDVVDTAVYGSLREAAFNPRKLERLLRGESLDDSTATDLATGNFLFGRGSMDMKCGVAVEMELLRDFAANRQLFDVNLLLLLVPDEENASAGMRGAAPWLAQKQRKEGLEYLAAINAEPTEAGLPSAQCPTIFLGTVGKIMPVFLCLGRESHVGAYYDGLSAPLLSSHILTLAEGNPELADPANGECCPSWICLEQKILREGYSVTVPGTAVLYFNCFTIANSPAAVLEQMRGIAGEAARQTLSQLQKSRLGMTKLGLPAGRETNWRVEIRSVEEIRRMVMQNAGESGLEESLARHMDGLDEPDPREAGIALMRRLATLAQIDDPLIMYGFLPPYYPPRSSLLPGPGNAALVQAARDTAEEAKARYGIRVELAPYFTGLCDLSYFGFQGDPASLTALENNMPGWGKIYSIPTGALAELNVPIINFGPSGRDPHKKTERLEKKFSLEQYPLLLEFLIKAIAARNSR